MPLLGHDSLVADNPHHEPNKSYLLGPHGSGRHQVIASAEDAALGQGMDVAHDADQLDISSEDYTSDNNIFPTSSSGSHHSLSIHQPRKTFAEKLIVSSTVQYLASSPIALASLV